MREPAAGEHHGAKRGDLLRHAVVRAAAGRGDVCLVLTQYHQRMKLISVRNTAGVVNLRNHVTLTQSPRMPHATLA